MDIKTKEQILSEVTGESIYEIRRGHEVQMIRPSECSEAMDIFAKQEAILYSQFKREYQLIEGMNVRHDQIENHNGNIYSWIGASDEVIWEAYKKGEQIKRYFEK